MFGKDRTGGGALVRSAALAAYLGATALAGGLVRRKIAQRAAAGKEDTARLPERFGTASHPRPDAPLVWFHAASVGESLSILELITQMVRVPASIAAPGGE